MFSVTQCSYNFRNNNKPLLETSFSPGLTIVTLDRPTPCIIGPPVLKNTLRIACLKYTFTTAGFSDFFYQSEIHKRYVWNKKRVVLVLMDTLFFIRHSL